MQVFANLCEPHSFMRSIMKSGETYSIAACNFFEGLSLNTSALKKSFPNNPITVSVTGHTLFSKIYIDYIQMHASYQLSGDYRKFIEVLNLNGKLLFSIGLAANPYGGSGGDVQPLSVYTWNEDGSLKTSKTETSGLYPLAVFSNYTGRAPNRALSYHYVNDPNDITKSKIDIYYGSELLLTLSGPELGNHIDRDPATAYFYRNTFTTDSTNYRHRIGYIIVTDTLDFSLEPVILKPLALTYSADFTGTVAALKENFQDEVYVSCSAETGKYIEFTLGKMTGNYGSLVTNGDLVSGAMAFYSRYLQIGGTSVTFTISIYNGAILYYSEDVTVAANENSLYYQTKMLSAIDSAVSGLKALQLQAFTVRITLKEI